MRDIDLTEESGHHINHKSKMSSSSIDYTNCTNSNLNTRGDGGSSGGGGGNSAMIGLGTNNIRSPLQNTDIPLGHPHHPQFPSNHPLGALSNFMGITGLHNLPNLPNGDVLEKLKMQVRDMKVGLMDQDYSPHGFSHQSLATPPNTAFALPTPNLGSFGHHSQSLSHQSQSSSSSLSHQQSQSSSHQNNSHSISNGYPFTSPNAPCTKDANPASNSSTSSEASNSSQQNNGWSFEEQYKQVRQLYEINDDPKRKEFLDDLFSFMQKRGTPINRLPIMAKSVLDLYELYNLVIARGGLVDVINKKLWQEIIKGLHLPSSITSAAFTLRTQYMKYLYPYECEKKNLSTPAELQAAIDGNRREGRRSSYGQFEAMHTQLQMPQMPRPNVSSGMQQMSPLALVTHANQQTAAAAAAAAAHHRLMAPPLGQMPNIVTHELEQRMMEYLKLFQQKEARRSQSPEITPREALNALEMSRVALWSMYHNNTSPPSSVNASPVEPQREALNLSDSPPNITMKRERENSEPPHSDREDFNQHPPMKKSISTSLHDLPTQQQQQQQHQHQLHQQQTNENLQHHQRHKNRNENHFDDDDDEDHEIERHQMEHDEDDENNDDIRMHHSNLADTNLSGNENGRLNGHVNTIKKSPSLSPSKQLHNGHQQNDDFSLMSGMQFKITRKENSANGEQQLVVNLDLNGLQYEGILFAKVPSPTLSLSNTLRIPSTKTSNLMLTSGISPIKSNTLSVSTTSTVLTATTGNSQMLISPNNNNNNNNITSNITNTMSPPPSTINISNRSIQSNSDEIANGGGSCSGTENCNSGDIGVNIDDTVSTDDDNCKDTNSFNDSSIMAQTAATTTAATSSPTTPTKTLEDRLHSIVSSQIN
ncbi:protein dead ringer isoform X2 [Condylostylus longicornis]|nr:protein dead ringer isoform X2 [Condylostylus longicornis]